MSEIALPPALTEIEQHTFAGCTSLSEIRLPPTLADIGGCAFHR